MLTYHWVPAIVALLTVVANAAITYAAVSRHERVIEDLRADVQQAKTDIAVLRATAKGGGEA